MNLTDIFWIIFTFVFIIIFIYFVIDMIINVIKNKRDMDDFVFEYYIIVAIEFLILIFAVRCLVEWIILVYNRL